MCDSSLFAANLRAARKQKGLSQRQLAQALFLSTQAVSKWEQGESFPDVNRLCKLAQLLQISTDALLGVTPAGEAALIAADVGGTKSEFVLIDYSGRVIKRTVLQGVNPNTCGVQEACNVFRKAIDPLLQQGCRVTGIYIGGAGMASAGNGAAAEEILRRWYPNISLRCQSDICNVLAFAEDPANAIAVISGTGNVVFATNDGALKRFGGGGWRLETAGSGYDIGRQVLLAALEHRDGTGPATSLTEAVEQKLGGKVWDSIQKIYSEGPAFVASFTPAAIHAWQQGDAVATGIVHTNARRIADLIQAAAKSSPKASQVLMGGSLLTKSDPLFQLVVGMLDAALRPERITLPAVWGACLCCARMGGLPDPDYEIFEKSYTED